MSGSKVADEDQEVKYQYLRYVQIGKVTELMQSPNDDSLVVLIGIISYLK